MPTRADFELAAEKLNLAADQVGQLATAADRLDAASILHGGSLGHAVPHRIREAVYSARTCAVRIREVEATCRERAAIIADYEHRLELFDIAWGHYMDAAWGWSVQYDAWFSSDGAVSHPGPEPSPPNRPTPPPAWADVRRV